MPFGALIAPLVSTAISAIAGGFGNRSQRTTQTPNYTPSQQQLFDNLTNQQQRLSQPFDTGSYFAGEADDINHNAALHQKALEETLAARGITGPAVNYAKAGADRGRQSELARLRLSLPMIQQQFGTNALNSGINLFGATRPGSTTEQSGNVAGGITGNFGSTLAYLMGNGAFNKKAPGAMGQTDFGE